MMREFSQTFSDSIGTMDPYHFIKAFQKYAECGWLMSDTYNCFVSNFGKKFE
jgi:hypothetical protein